MDFEKLAERLGLKLDEFMELAELFLETGMNDLEDLKTAVSDKEINAVVERSHSIKGASGNLGFNDIYEVAKRIESNARNNILDGADAAVLEIDQYIGEISSFVKTAAA